MAKPVRTVHRPLVLCTRISVPITERTTNGCERFAQERSPIKKGETDRTVAIFLSLSLSLTIVSQIPGSPENDSEASGRAIPLLTADEEYAAKGYARADWQIGIEGRSIAYRVARAAAHAACDLREDWPSAVAGWETSG